MKWSEVIPSKRAEVLDFLLINPDNDYTISAIADNVDISRPTLYKIIFQMRDDGLITFRVMGKLTLYKLNLANKQIRLLIEITNDNLEEGDGK